MTTGFPTVELSKDDQEYLREYAASLVADHINHYKDYRRNGARTDHWKKFREQGDLCLYRQSGKIRALVKEQAISDMRTRSSESSVLPEYNDGTDPPLMLGVGSIPGTLDDVMLGLHTPTTELMKLKSAYMNDSYIDWAVLAVIVQPTQSDPFRQVAVKWAVKSHPISVIGGIARKRDMVFVETMGTTETEDGERIGYLLKHSIELAGFTEFRDYNVVRSRFSVAYCFRQLKPNTVEMFVRLHVKAGGSVPEVHVLASSSPMLFGIQGASTCGLMHKLEWLLKTSRVERSSELAASRCTVCHSKVGSSFVASTNTSEKTCRICSNRLCSSCRLNKTIFIISPMNKMAESVKITVCQRCVTRASETSAALVAWDHVAYTL